MTTDLEFERIAMAWLADGPDELSDRVLADVVDEIHVTRQRHGLRLPRRFESMTTPARVAAAAVIGVLAIGGTLYAIAPGTSGPAGPGPTASPSPTPVPTATPAPTPTPPFPPAGNLAAGTYVTYPFARADYLGLCQRQPGCSETPDDDTVQVTFTVPDGWQAGSIPVIWNSSFDGVGLVFERGGWLFDEPCGGLAPLTEVGPTVDDFVDALVAHPKLDVSEPRDVRLGGFTGKYLALRVPDDISACATTYYPWEPGLYGQGPGNRWQLWVLDVDGVRVVVQAMDYSDTLGSTRADLQSIVDSIQITP